MVLWMPLENVRMDKRIYWHFLEGEDKLVTNMTSSVRLLHALTSFCICLCQSNKRSILCLFILKIVSILKNNLININQKCKSRISNSSFFYYEYFNWLDIENCYKIVYSEPRRIDIKLSKHDGYYAPILQM